MKKILILIAIVILLVLGFFGYKNLVKQKQEQVSDVSLLKIKEKGKLVVGADIPYGIMEFFDESGKVVGVDVVIARKIADGLGVQLEFNNYGWDFLFPAVKNGEIDLVMSAITITKERQEEMLFSIPYFNGGQVLVTKLENKNINSINDITNKKVGVQVETTANDFAKKYVPEKSIFTYINTKEMVDALKNGKLDLFIVDYVEATSMVKQDSSLKIVGEPLTQEFYGIATKLGNDTLMNEINNILREMKRTGELNQIKNNWSK